jgi:hypothetical protein
LTFKELKKRVSLKSTTQEQHGLTERLHNKPFWIWNVEEHTQEDVRTNGDCCFNHIIGLPAKEGMEKAIFDYEKILYNSLLDNYYYSSSNNVSNYVSFKYKHLWVKKATGLGVTEFFIRLMACFVYEMMTIKIVRCAL